MKSLYIDNEIKYIGSQLSPHWIYKNFNIKRFQFFIKKQYLLSDEGLGCAEQGYLDGLTEGSKSQWHDLRKDPNDLPKESGKYIIHIKVSEKRTITDTCDFFNGYFGQYIKPIAWCELPKFEE